MKSISLKWAGLPLVTLSLIMSGQAQAASCSAAKKAEILSPATLSDHEVYVNCGLTLNSNDKVTRNLIFYGSQANNTTFNCNGATIQPIIGNEDAILFKPKHISGTNYQRPQNITVKNCTVKGSVRLNPSYLPNTNQMGPSSVNAVRNSAPKHITLDNLNITSNSRVPVFFHQGVTYSTLKNSKITNNTDKNTMYMARESAYNRVENNEFHSNSNNREILAVDASENNVITRNWFTGLSEGGIYMYRNCGEDGTIRYTTPSHNEITGNVFYYKNYNGSKPGIYVGARNGNKSYCNDDKGWYWVYDGVESSSTDDRDFARDNLITANKVCNRNAGDVIKQGFTVNTPNDIYNNSRITCNTATPFPRPVPSTLWVNIIPERLGVCTGNQDTFVFDAEARGEQGPYTFSWTGVSSVFSGPTDNPNSAMLRTSGTASALVEVTSANGKTASDTVTVSANCTGAPL